jgi:hypothetical protein
VVVWNKGKRGSTHEAIARRGKKSYEMECSLRE